MLSRVRSVAADILRGLAYRLDGTQLISARWHRHSVQSMNEYIYKTERYIARLEGSFEGDIDALRSEYRRLAPWVDKRWED